MFIPENAILYNENNTNIKSVDSIAFLDKMKASDNKYVITTNNNYQVSLFGETKIKVYSDGQEVYKKVNELKPNDAINIVKNFNNTKESESSIIGVNDDNIPKILGMTLIARMNNISLLKAVKEVKDEFVSLLGNVKHYIKEPVEKDEIMNWLNYFYRYCNTGTHIIPSIINRFNKHELTVFSQYMLNLYAYKVNNEFIITITHDAISALYINILLHKIGIKSYVEYINEQYGYIYKIHIDKENADILMKNIETFEQNNNFECIIEADAIKSIVNLGKKHIGYKINVEDDGVLILNDIKIQVKL